MEWKATYLENMRRLRVGILGATGAVGQQFVRLLDAHPWFEVTVLAASSRSAGKEYQEAANWIGSEEIPRAMAGRTVMLCEPGVDCDFVFSGLDSKVAGEIETAFAAAGYPVVSNARNHRMALDVPLLIPEINPDHIGLIDRQEWGHGFIVTNPNCSTVGLTCALKPIVDTFGVSRVHVTTMQALSGAGYPGVSSLDILGNVVPYIGGEEEKLEGEPLKIMGSLTPDGVMPLQATISAHCNRVPVLDGHLETVSLSLGRPASPGEVMEAFRTFKSPIDELQLPSSPEHLFRVFEDPRYPQPRRHSLLGGGMTVSVGRIRGCPLLDVRLVVLSHNTIRGAAGGAILNAELLHSQGRLRRR